VRASYPHGRRAQMLVRVLTVLWEWQGGAPPGQKPRSLMETLRPKLQVPTAASVICVSNVGYDFCLSHPERDFKCKIGF